MNVSEWIEQYRTQSDSRFATFSKAFELFHERGGRTIVETGCVRLPGDWGAGMSTFLFGQYCKTFSDTSIGGKHAFTVDISPVNMTCCKDVTREYAEYITYVVADSVAFLSLFSHPIHFLYLDSVDCPVEVTNDEEAKELAYAQNHQLQEITIALPKVAEGGVILLDDNGFTHGGKTTLTKNYLKEQGWTEIMGGQQSLWDK